MFTIDLMRALLGDRLMVGQRVLDPFIGVQIPVPQPRIFIVRIMYNDSMSKKMILIALLLVGSTSFVGLSIFKELYSKQQSSKETTDLTTIYSNLNKNNEIKECHYFENCYPNIFTPNIKFEIASKYSVVNKRSDNGDISIGLLKGSSIDITGIGTGYLKNKAALNLQDTKWYWEIGACSTNNRIFIDAVSGEAGILHKFIYCGGTP